MMYDGIKTEKRNKAHLQKHKYTYIQREREFMSVVFSVKNLPVLAMLLIINRS